MTLKKYAAGFGAIACLLASTGAFAADATRSADTLPAPAAQQPLAPTNGIRTSTELRKKSKALGGPGAIVGGVLAAGIVVAGVIVATDDDDGADSPG
jgi:hypothetical protein